MKRLVRFILPLALAGAVEAQSGADKQLADARKELGATRDEYTAMRRALYREINTLDDQALELGRELRKLEKDAARRTTQRFLSSAEIRSAKSSGSCRFLFDFGFFGGWRDRNIHRFGPSE